MNLTPETARGARDSKRRNFLRTAMEGISDQDLVECIDAELWFRCLNLKIGDAGNTWEQNRMLACREALRIVR